MSVLINGRAHSKLLSNHLIGSTLFSAVDRFAFTPESGQRYVKDEIVEFGFVEI